MHSHKTKLRYTHCTLYFIYKVHKIFYNIFPNGVCTRMKYVQYFPEWCISPTIATLKLRFYPDYTTMQRNQGGGPVDKQVNYYSILLFYY